MDTEADPTVSRGVGQYAPGYATGTAQSFEAVKLPAASQPAIVQVLVLPLALDADESSAVPRAASAEARPPPDPIFLSTLRLRV